MSPSTQKSENCFVQASMCIERCIRENEDALEGPVNSRELPMKLANEVLTHLDLAGMLSCMQEGPAHMQNDE